MSLKKDPIKCVAKVGSVVLFSKSENFKEDLLFHLPKSKWVSAKLKVTMFNNIMGLQSVGIIASSNSLELNGNIQNLPQECVKDIIEASKMPFRDLPSLTKC